MRNPLVHSHRSMYIRSRAGFTLIELLVVIAIIGILAAVVLASLSDARSSAQNAAIKQTLSNARSQAEIVYNQSGFSYDTVCGNAKIQVLVNDASAKGADGGVTDFDGTPNTPGTWNVATCHDTANSWVIFVPLTDSTSGAISAWCIDAAGAASRETVGLGATAVVCP